MLSDLTDAFNFYEANENLGVISIDHFKNILTNFGYHKVNKKDIDHEMTKMYAEYPKCTGVDLKFVCYVISKKWNSP